MTHRGIVLTAIITPLIVGLLLLKIEYSFFSISGQSDRALQKEAEKVLVSLQDDEEKPDESYIEPNIGDLEVLFKVAQNIYGSTERNEEYVKIITLSLEEDKPGFAFIVAKNIYGSNDRNTEYSKIIDRSIELEKYNLALAVARNIYGSDFRNKKYKEIIAAGVKKRTIMEQPPIEKTDSSEDGITYNKALKPLPSVVRTQLRGAASPFCPTQLRRLA